MRKEDAAFAGEVSGHYYFRDFSQADSGVVPFLLMLELISKQRPKLSEILAPLRSRYFITGEINTPVAGRRAQAAGAEGALRRRARLAPRRDLGRLRRLALQRPPLEHRAAAAPQPRGDVGGADGAEARRGARGDPLVSGDRTSLQSRGRASASRTPTRRGSSTTAATTRTSTSRASSTSARSGSSHRAARRRLRDAGERRRVLRAGRASTTSSRSTSASRGSGGRA